jgi:hypothetical protein
MIPAPGRGRREQEVSHLRDLDLARRLRRRTEPQRREPDRRARDAPARVAFKTASWRAQQGLDGGERGADSEVVDEVTRGVGAYIMGRKMYGGGGGPWDEAWTGCGARSRPTTPRCSC